MSKQSNAVKFNKNWYPFTLIRNQTHHVWLVGYMIVWNASFSPDRVSWEILIKCWFYIKSSKL